MNQTFPHSALSSWELAGTSEEMNVQAGQMVGFVQELVTLVGKEKSVG
ncbi:hypothetical protein QUF80_17555 [Desulfococcaceae bacterium HSG8]|nr:hypothetical protein [Desulfococcaceae bacterium HSG8]